MTHPFHPLHGRELPLVTYTNAWGEDRVYFNDDEGSMVALPASWTDVVGPDPTVVVSKGRAYFRLQDLIRLIELVEGLKAAGGEGAPAHEQRKV